MSDEAPATAPATSPAANPVVANATQALAIKELGESVAGVRKQIRTLWIALAVLAVVTLALGALSIGPRLGFGMMGGTRPNWQRDTPGAAGATGSGSGASFGGAQDQVIEIKP